MSKCEHGLTTKECYVCMSPKYAERQQALDKKADNARELGLDYEPVPWIESMTIDSTNELSKPTAPVQEPVVEVLNERGEVDYISYVPPAGTFLYTTPQPQREFVGLTEEEIALVCAECAASAHNWNDISFARAIEQALKEKNT